MFTSCKFRVVAARVTSVFIMLKILQASVITTDICKNVFLIVLFRHRCALLKLSQFLTVDTQAMSSILLATLSLVVG